MRTDQKCNICHEDFNDDWECSTLCVHGECLRHLLEELESEKEKLRIAVIHLCEYKAWVKKAEAELESQAKDYAQRHIGFAKEVQRWSDKLDRVCAACRTTGKITLCEECEVARS